MIKLKNILNEGKVGTLMQSLENKFNFKWTKETKTSFTNEYQPLQVVSHPSQLHFNDIEKIIFDKWYTTPPKEFNFNDFIKEISKKHKITKGPSKVGDTTFVQFDKDRQSFKISFGTLYNFLTYEAIKG